MPENSLRSRHIATHIDPARREKRMFHLVGEGTFVVDGRRLDRRKMMAAKIPQDF